MEIVEWFLVEYIKYALFFAILVTLFAVWTNGDSYSKLEYARIFIISLILFPFLFGSLLFIIIEDYIISGRSKDD